MTEIQLNRDEKSQVRQAGSRSAFGSVSDSRARGPGFDIRSGNIFSFLLPLIQEGQLSVTGESMCTQKEITSHTD